MFVKTIVNYAKQAWIKKVSHWINPKSPLNILFMGTPLSSVPFLAYLIKHEHVVGVFTAPDLPAGRHMKIKISPVKQEALSHNIPVFQPNNLSHKTVIRQIQTLKPDLIVVVAYGYKIPKEILEISSFSPLNIHFSLLPKFRGAAPINWAIISGAKITGVSSFCINNRMDSGDILCQKSMTILEDDNAEILSQRLWPLGIEVLIETLQQIKNKTVIPVTQNETQSTKAPKLKKSDGKIDWSMTNIDICNRIKGLYPWPGSYTYLDTGDTLKMVKIFDPKTHYLEEEGSLPGEVLRISKNRGLLVKCLHNAIWIKRIQLEGHRIVTGYEFYVGRRIQKGDVFTS